MWLDSIVPLLDNIEALLIPATGAIFWVLRRQQAVITKVDSLAQDFLAYKLEESLINQELRRDVRDIYVRVARIEGRLDKNGFPK